MNEAEEIMIYLKRTILLTVCLTVLSVATPAQQPVDSKGCTNQLIYPNADLDNYDLRDSGPIQRIETRETDLEDSKVSDLVAIVNFNQVGNITDTFFTNAKIKVFGKEIYSYDSKKRLSLTVSYNPDGTAVLEDVFTYDNAGNLKQVITRNAKSKVIIWNKQFSYDPTNQYSMFIDKGHDYGFKFMKDNQCRIIELTSHKSNGTITSKVFVVYDDKNNLWKNRFTRPQGS